MDSEGSIGQGGWLDDVVPAGDQNPVRMLEVAFSFSDPQQTSSAIAEFFIDCSSSDYATRTIVLTELLDKKSCFLHKVIQFLKKNQSVYLGSCICTFIHVCLSPSNKETRMALMTSLVSSNTVEVLFRLLATHDPPSKWDDSFLSIIQVLAKVCSKDRNSPLKARLIGAVKPLHATVIWAPKGSKLILPTLLVIKLSSKNVTNQLNFGNLGCVSTLFSMWGSISKTNWLIAKIIAEIISLLVKTRSNIGRMLKENGLYRFLSVIDSWEKIDKRHQYKLLRASFSTINHVIETKSGRNSFISLRGVDCLQRFASMCSSDRKFDLLFGSAVQILLTCLSTSTLPLTSLHRNINFIHKGSVKSSSNDCAIDSDDEADRSDSENEVNCESPMNYRFSTVMMTDLPKMNVFFPEFNDFNVTASSLIKYPYRKTGNENQSYLDASMNTKSLFKFVKIAYPDLIQADSIQEAELLYQNDVNLFRSKQLECVKRIINQSHENERIVFDFDFLVETDRSHDNTHAAKPLVNMDPKRIGKHEEIASHLNFESRFESGNLRRAIQVSGKEYDLLLNPDINSSHHHQWFYFEVSNMAAGTPYVFNIVNNEKSNSEFNYGMKPVLFSVTEAMNGNPHWIRTGGNISYHRNHYSRSFRTSRLKMDRGSTRCSYYTATFTIEFPHSDDVCYLAYHYPYTHTKLQTFLSSLSIPSTVFYSNQLLCHTLNNNSVSLITITGREGLLKDKDVIFLTSRVHPGESNSSWMMQGIITTLLSDSSLAYELNKKYIFKIVPMLNPEGTIHGNQRCGLTNEDLNRCWLSPNPEIHPSIYHTKALVEYLTTALGKKPLVFCDLHGHSRQKNIFMYGCSRQLSWLSADRANPVPESYHILPRIAFQHMSTFCLKSCRFHIERERESTARVSVWRQLKIPFSYTIEASASGCNIGIHKGNHLNTHLLLESGCGFCRALLELSSELKNSSNENEDSSEVINTLQSRSRSEYSSDLDLDLDLYGTT